MKKALRLVAVALVLAMSLFATGCNVDVFDDNDAIINGNDSQITTNAKQVVTNSLWKLEAKSFTGMYTIETKELSGEVTFDFTMTVQSGRCKFVLVNANSVIVVADEDVSSPVTLTLDSDTYRLKLVGDSANILFEYKR